ncbi:MAG TPA: FKBP-type peptidyl-prolyl cis-trans isomerase [archaeon]|nr:FKBP-type peptidyl-prolyl cis-trans isomerase [archaeon]
MAEIKVDESKNKESKRILKVTFNGKELLEGRVFDTTSAEIAKQNNMFDEKRKYGPLSIITGEHELLPLVEKELLTMKVGEVRKVKMTPKESFGERNNDLVRVTPIKIFHDQKINPIPGLVISVGNAYGRVQSVSGGRVRVDFNHALAGREIEYEVKIENEITDKKEIAEIIFEKYYSFVPGSKKEIKENKLIVELTNDTLKNLEKINASITRLGKEFGIELEFKPLPEKKSVEKEIIDETKNQKVDTKKE